MTLSLRFITTAVPAVCLMAAGAGAVEAPVVNLPTVKVGNAGNPADYRYSSSGWGSVNYNFYMGKFEVTAGQYTAFLNAVAATDTYGLYPSGSAEGPRIQRSGLPGSYTYSVAPDWANRPVNLVSWGDAARFANWMHNGQPQGPQGLSTTEDGAYFLNGATTDAALISVTRKPGARWAIPTENEWYKAAYHKNDGVTGNYWLYPTATDELPSNLLIEPDPGNNANVYYNDIYTIGPPYYRTEVGEFENSESAYGTYDQGGNVFEWLELEIGSYRARRGGGYRGAMGSLGAYSGRDIGLPSSQSVWVGFRLIAIPEPGSLALLMLGGLAAMARRRSC